MSESLRPADGTIVRPYQCGQCDRRFVDRSGLARHINLRHWSPSGYKPDGLMRLPVEADGTILIENLKGE